jgi:hypothetical protein
VVDAVSTSSLEPARLAAALDAPDVATLGGPRLAAVRALLGEATLVADPGIPRLVSRGRTLGRVLAHGSVVLDDPAGPRTCRIAEVDPDGHVTALVRRDAGGGVEAAQVRMAAGQWLGVLPGGAEHPAWGASDRVARLVGGAWAAPLTVCEAIAWDRIAAIPALADPTRLPPGAGTAILNLLAGLAEDQQTAPLRYHGPYPTEQLFWALVESYRFDPRVAEPLAAFTASAEAAIVGAAGSAPGPAAAQRPPARLDWTPAPHERRLLSPGLAVALRDGVERITWDGRAYHRLEIQGLRRRGHRIVRLVSDDEGRPCYAASLWALDRVLEDQWLLDAGGGVLARPRDDPREPLHDAPLAAAWRDALGALLPLEATPLLATAIAAVWRGLTVGWGPVARDLVEEAGGTLRLSWRLARAYRATWGETPASRRRTLAQGLVRDVLGILGDPVRRAAVQWLVALPSTGQEAALAEAAALDRATAAAGALTPLGQLLAVLEAGQGCP